jgi:NADH:ubiquinone oxidoreductase subunit K
MVQLLERLPWYAWVTACILAVVAGAVFFIPPSLATTLGLSFEQFLIAISAIELTSAIGIGAIVVHYRTTDYEEPEYKFDP